MGYNTMNNSMTDVPGIQIGHYTNITAATGCTVILCPEGTTAGVDVRGGAPGTRDVALLHPICTIEEVHAVLLSGGSAFGLAAADGVMQWLEENNIGFETTVAKIPIVPSAILFDLAIGSSQIRPTGADGYAACQNASSRPVAEGTVGAGTGATVGKINGPSLATKSGIGTSSLVLENGLIIGAIVAVNAIGDVIDPNTQKIIAGTRSDSSNQFADSMSVIRQRAAMVGPGPGSQNTTIGAIATNARLTKAEATKVAQMAHDGLARTIRPIHTAFDGDTIFTLATNGMPGDVSQIGAIAAEVMTQAVLRAVQTAESVHAIPAAKDLAR